PELLTLITLDVGTGRQPHQSTVGIISTQLQCGPAHVARVDLDRHVRPIADFTGNGGPADISTEADTVEANILGMLEEVARSADITFITDHRCAAGKQVARNVGIQRVTAVIVHRIEAELGIVQFRREPAESHPILATVTRLLILLSPSNIAALGLSAMGQIQSVHHQPVVTPAPHHVRTGEEGTAVIRDGSMPLQLVERLHGQVLGQPLRQIQHLNRLQTFLQFRTRTAESGSIDRVDRVDTVLDEDTLTPADDLAAEAHVAWVIANGIVVVDESVEQLDTGALLQGVAAGIIDIVEVLAAVLGLEVVPIVAADEGAGATVAQFQIVGALENLGKHISFFVIQTSVVRCPSCRLTALILAVDFGQGMDETLVRIGC